MEYRDSKRNPVRNGGGITTEYATGALVIGCVIALWGIRRGFRGLNVPGVGNLGVR